MMSRFPVINFETRVIEDAFSIVIGIGAGVEVGEGCCVAVAVVEGSGVFSSSRLMLFVSTPFVLHAVRIMISSAVNVVRIEPHAVHARR